MASTSITEESIANVCGIVAEYEARPKKGISIFLKTFTMSKALPLKVGFPKSDAAIVT